MYLAGEELKRALWKAKKEGYAILGSNFADGTTARALVQAGEHTRADHILQISVGAAEFASGDAQDIYEGGRILAELGRALAGQYKNCGIGLHIDHVGVEYFDFLKYVIERELVSSVMIDGSGEELEENIRITREIVDLAHRHGIIVEGEIGRVGGGEEGEEGEIVYTEPVEALEFVLKSNVDMVAVCVGTRHGVMEDKGEVRFELLEEIDGLLKQHGVERVLVLHGATGLSGEELRAAIRGGVAKINVNTCYQMAFARAVQEFWEENKDAIVRPLDVEEEMYGEDKGRFDPRNWLKIAEKRIEKACIELMEIVGCAGKSIVNKKKMEEVEA